MWQLRTKADGGAEISNGDRSLSRLAVDAAGNFTAPTFVDVLLSSAQLKALNATPIQLVAAPGAGKALVFEGAVAVYTKGTTDYTIASNKDVAVKYTNGSGLAVGQLETTGLLDTASGFRYVAPYRTASGSSDITPVANAALVANMTTGEITAGDGTVKLRVFYRTIPTTL